MKQVMLDAVSRSEPLDEAIRAIAAAPERAHTVASLAAIAFMSRSAFARAFTAHTGTTPMAYVRRVRLERGAELLRTTSLDVNAVAAHVGFHSRSQFSRAFRARYGRSPGAFRATGSRAGLRRP